MNSEDQFDRLPDALLLLILSRLPDARSLTVCLSVSKRFSSLVPLADTVYLSIPPRKRNPEPSGGSPLNLFAILRRRRFIAKSLQCFSCFTDSEPEEDEIESYFSTKDALKNFKGIKSLQIQFPFHGGELGPFGDDSLLKWMAEYGSELKRCVVLGATSFYRSEILSFSSEDQIGEEQTLDENELKIRVVWTISSLVSASARHFLLRHIAADHPELERVVISDVKKQGELLMGKEELSELRSSGNLQGVSGFSILGRGPVPELSLKLWYLPVLELPESGWVMKGATLAVIGPSGDGMAEAEKKICDGDDELDKCFDGEGDEEKAFGEAVRKMMKVKRNYLMTMSSS